MQIILVPGSASRQSRCLKTRNIILSILIIAVVVPITGAISAYRLGVSQATYQPDSQQLRLAYVQTTLENHQRELNDAGRVVEQQLDTLGRRLGHMQARMSRLNALGKRLTSMANLEADEFNFDAEPAIGGPANASPSDQTAADLIAALDTLGRNIDNKKEELEVLEVLLMDRELHRQQYPDGSPVQEGWLSSAYGYRNDPFTGKRSFHDGVDIAAKPGVPIEAIAAGVVTTSREKPGYGVTVEINHGNGYTTRYAHAKVAKVNSGDRVEKGDVVAIVGSTGRSTGTHLHFEVMRDGETVNPRKYLRASL
jgi:murein DD-endopeptidase MepM/ murein hydrolase activator NlpD